jgi:hypothetical protein
MTYEEFIDFVPAKCMYETIYEDSEGRLILVIDMLSAYGMVNKFAREEREACAKVCEEYETENDITATWLNIVADAIRVRGNT